MNYKQMSLKELRCYVLANRQDKEAWTEFRSRPRPKAVTIPANTTPEEINQILREAISHQSHET